MTSELIDGGPRARVRARGGATLRRMAAVDVGSSFVRVALPSQMVAEEPSAVVVEGDRVMATGWAALTAQRMGGRKRGVVNPVCGGAPAAPDLYTELVRQVARRAALAEDRPSSLRVALPVGLSPEQRTETLSCLTDAMSTSDVEAVLAPVAAAVGMHLSSEQGTACLVVDVGHHLTEAAVVSGGDALAAHSGWIGGADASAVLSDHVLRVHGVKAAPRSIERALRRSPQVVFDKVIVRGLDVSTGASMTVQIGAYELEEVLDPVLEDIADVALRTLTEVDADTVDAVRRHGVLLSGGMARVHGVADRLAIALDASVSIGDAPGRAVVNGLRWHGDAGQRAR